MADLSIDEKVKSICLWKELSNDPKSTTFYHVRITSLYSPLKKCLFCTGKPDNSIIFQYVECQDYVSTARIKKYKI